MLPKILKFLRTSNKLTQEDVGVVLGVTRQAIALYEAGRRTPDYTSLIVLADLFNVTLDCLCGRTHKLTDSNSGKAELVIKSQGGVICE